MLAQEELMPYKRIKNINIKTVPKRKKIISIQLLILYIIAFFMARVFMLGEMMPFGIAFFVAVFGALNMEVTLITGFISILGYFSVLDGNLSISHIVVLLLLTIVMLFMKNKDKHRVIKMSAVTFALVVFAKVFFQIEIIAQEMTTYDWLFTISEGVVVVASIYIFSYGIPIYFNNKRRKELSKEELICLGFIFAVAIAGMWDIKYAGLSMRNMWMYFIVLCVGYVEGPALGAAWGITLGMICGLTDATMRIGIQSFGFCGLIGGMFKNLGKVMVATSYFLAFIIVSLYDSGFTNIGTNILDITFPIIVFLLIPEVKYKRTENFFAKIDKDIDFESTYIKKTKDLMDRKISALSRTLGGLSEVLSKNIDSELSYKAEINGMIEKLADRVCLNCDLRSSCWKKNFYFSYDSFGELLRNIEKIGKATNEDMPKGLNNICIRPNELIKQSNYIYEIFKLNNKWRKKLINSKIIVSEQVKGITEIMQSMTAEISASMDFRSDVEEQIAIALDRNGQSFEDVLAIKNGKGKYEVTIYKRPCLGNTECKKNFGTIISKTLGLRMTRESGKCKINDECSICQFRFVEAENYNILTAVGRISKEEVSGDSYTFASISDGRYLMALSDGMGSGARAAIESNTTIALLEKFIEAGFDRNTALKAINSVLVLRSNDESFATIDMGVIDLHSGMGEFVKIGCAPTYIKSGMEVDVIKSTSIPVGILDEIEIESQIISFKNGDMIVMVTDGVIDANEEKSERWITKALKEYDCGNPKEVAEYILNKAKVYYGDRIGDDMTVMVSKIWKIL